MEEQSKIKVAKINREKLLPIFKKAETQLNSGVIWAVYGCFHSKLSYNRTERVIEFQKNQ